MQGGHKNVLWLWSLWGMDLVQLLAASTVAMFCMHSQPPLVFDLLLITGL